ncbi:ABC transporter permease [Thalassospira tepidiphila]|uniref:Simple sugar transport system permease protein n=1 Tax=Thalassospira tepidiphila TaxID=393657 RepID=A0ABX0X0R0_9PROT|nr:ABC transporter permease [Thalassospira tepidiphila]NJB75228.1 simple sugar transport system permease protein [Thalassospira tepidiphila]
MSKTVELPRWIDVGALPLLNLLLALVVSGLVVLAIGENPIQVVEILLYGAFGYEEAWGYTLYYTTNFIFTGLAFAVAFHCGLFNIGAEGQAYIGGLGVTLAALYLDFLPFPIMLVVAMLAAMIFGAAWAYIPAYLQARRGSHVVITTIMFNFIASSLMVYLLVNVLRPEGSMTPESEQIAEHLRLPFIHDIAGALGIEMASSPLNLSFVYAIVISVMVWLFIWHTRWGYAIRTVGANAVAATYAGLEPGRFIIIAMMISGALSSFVALNEVMGVQHRLLIDFTAGYGFVGIAVALMGRNHPFGIFLAALLFGMLYQGGAELSFEIPTISNDMVVVIQGLVILFTGAMEHMFRPRVTKIYTAWRLHQDAGEAA